MVEQRDAEDAYRLEALRRAVHEGIVDIDAGRSRLLNPSKANAITCRALQPAL